MKGRVEAGVKYVKNSFVPLRQFRTLTDANEQLKRWLLETAGNILSGSITAILTGSIKAIIDSMSKRGRGSDFFMTESNLFA